MTCFTRHRKQEAQDRQSVCAGSANLCQSGQHVSRPWRCHWQITDHVWPCRRSLPRCLLSAPTAMPDHPFTDRRRRKVAGPGLHCMSPGLLQFSVLRYLGQSLSAFAVCSECGSAGHNWHQPMRPHHTSVEATPLVTSSTARRVQISRARLQISSWPHGAISDRQLSTGRQLRSPHAGYGRLT